MRSVRLHVLLLSSFVLVACSGAEESPVPGAEATPGARSEASSPDETPRSDGSGSLPRVVVIGTSLTAGYGLPDPERQAWPARLSDRAEEAQAPIEVVNAGVSGDTSAGGLRRLDWILQRPVDLLVIELGANDGLRGLPVDALEANLDSIVVRARRIHPDLTIALAPMEAPPNLGPEYVGSFRSAFVRVAERHDLILLPFLLDGIAGIDSLNQDDGIHPTAEGHRRMAENVFDTLLPALNGLRRAP